MIEFPGRVDVGERRDGRPVLKFDGGLETLPVSRSEMSNSTALRWFSNNSQRDIHFDKHVVEEHIGTEEEQQIFSQKFVEIRSRRDVKIRSRIRSRRRVRAVFMS